MFKLLITWIMSSLSLNYSGQQIQPQVFSVIRTKTLHQVIFCWLMISDQVYLVDEISVLCSDECQAI